MDESGLEKIFERIKENVKIFNNNNAYNKLLPSS